MARKQRGARARTRAAAESATPDAPTAGRRRRGSPPGDAYPAAPTTGGLATLRPDADRRDAWELLVDSAPQSHVDLATPTRLTFEYQRRLGHAADLAAPPGRPVHALHLGGGAATLARYIAATRPRSVQQVAEPDSRLTAFVRTHLPLPPGARIRVRAQDARALLARLPEHWADLIVSDVFAGARTPAHCSSGEYLDAVRRVLAPGGWYTANLTDGGALSYLRGQVATARSRFAEVAIIADPAVLRGRRFGNAILAAADTPLPTTELGRRAAADPHPARLLAGRELRDFAGGAPVVTDATAVASPPPPSGTFD